MPSPKAVDVDIELDAATLDFFKAKWPDDYAERMSAILSAYVRAQLTKDHLGHAVEGRRRAGLDCSTNMLAHISPLGWAHILLTGEYRWGELLNRAL